MTGLISGRQVRSNLSWLGGTREPWARTSRQQLTKPASATGVELEIQQHRRRSMTLTRTLVAVAVAVATLTVTQVPVSADCSGPTIAHDVGSIDRDGTVQVIGSGWGNNCYDTGPPPEGEGVLGKPVTGIKIFLVQDGVEHLVATGNADTKYEFEVDVPVPDDLEPGPIELVARSDLDMNTFDRTPEQMVVSERPPTGASDDAPVRFGATEPEPAPNDAESPEGSPEDDDGSGVPVVVIAVGAMVLVAGLVAAATRWRRRP
jgi:hypothetical protein